MMAEGKKEKKESKPKAYKEYRLGMVPERDVKVKNSIGEEMSFKIRIISNDQFFDLQEQIGQFDLGKLDPHDTVIVKKAYTTLLLANIIKCPDGKPPDEEFVKWLDPLVSSGLIEGIVPKNLEEIEAQANL